MCCLLRHIFFLPFFFISDILLKKIKREETSPPKHPSLLFRRRFLSKPTHYKDMIRIFYAFGKSLFNKTSDLLLFQDASNAFAPDDFVCPKCGRKHDCSFIQPYDRYLISLENGGVVTHTIQVKQVKCASCGSIHAILPDNLVPYSSYSLSFILTVLRAYFFRSSSVESLCIRFMIAISTLYAWIKLFHFHKKLWLGILRNAEISSGVFIDSIKSSQFSSDAFFQLSSFSFLQGAFTTRFNSS